MRNKVPELVLFSYLAVLPNDFIQYLKYKASSVVLDRF
jgi:hypothetical protein